MTKEQKNLIVVIAVVLIAGGIFYYQKQKQAIVPEDLNDTITPEGENAVITPEPEPTAEEILQQKVNSANSAELKAQEAAKRQKWNLAMNNATGAFGRGEYDRAVAFYNEALSYYKTDTAYSGLFVVYSAQNNIEGGRVAIEAAIALNPGFAEYWNSKLTLLDEKTNLSFADLKKVYTEGLMKVGVATKINLVTHFARIAETNREYKDAISLWEYAKNLYPENTLIYQAEIDRLQKM
jgi:tetratricopeptide (TPR) repeat protein